MKVILLGELRGKGGEGDVVEVPTGYAVNYLFPKKLAIHATAGNLKQLELRKHNIAKRETDRLDTADKLLAALDGQRVRIGAKVGEEGQLFGSVTSAQVAESLTERFGVEIDRRRIDLHGAVKTAGEHPATISIYRDVKANIVVEVVDEKALTSAAEADDAAGDEGLADKGAEATAEADDAAGAEGLADKGAEATAEADDAAGAAAGAEAGATVGSILEQVDEELERVAVRLVEAVDASEEGDDQSIAAAAEEVFQEVEGVLDAAIAEAVAQDVDANSGDSKD
jgi:large subunit ribosomal protein L9